MTHTATHLPAHQSVVIPQPRREGERGPRPLGPAQRRPLPSPSGWVVPGHQRGLAVLERLAPTALRLSLGLVFVWFGALKLSGDSPVLALVSATIPWVAPSLLMAVLGVVEVLLGLGLMVGLAQRLLLLVLAAHLTGTFLSFVMAPEMLFQHGNGLLLTTEGEFVLKNLVFISGALLLAASGVRSR